jgi:DNA-directed RNA polymerase subunit RPC12/RpoP
MYSETPTIEETGLMPHYKCAPCKTRLYSAASAPELVGDLCPECGALLEPVGRLAEIVGYRSIKWRDDSAVGEAAQAVALPRPETYP